MLNLLNDIIWGTENFGFGIASNGNPAVFVFGVPIYLYALIIVIGMCVAILVAGLLFKKRGIDPYDICTYALVIIPLGVLGARLYVYIFPWAGRVADWSTFFDFRGGGLGIYGGVILGYFGALATSKVLKQAFKVVSDCIIPGLFIAQSIGRWGNFANGEAFGPPITNPAWQWFPFGVEINGVWHNATFFYESMATLLGFVVCLLLFRNKKYKLGWLTAFYGIYYGIVRILVESLRTDSLYLWLGSHQTDIKISQLVSVFTIILGLYTLSRIYRKQLHALYSRLFKSEYDELHKSRFVLLGVIFVCVAVAILLLVLGGESNFIASVALLAIAIYSVLGIFATNDRLKLYCKNCKIRNNASSPLIYDKQKNAVKFVYFSALSVLLFIFAIVFLIMGFANGVPNLFVLATICAILLGLVVFAIVKQKLYVHLSRENFQGSEVEITCQCGVTCTVKPNAWLLVLFPFKEYKDFGVEHLKPFVAPQKPAKQKK